MPWFLNLGLTAAGVVCPQPASHWAHQHFNMHRGEKPEALPLQRGIEPITNSWEGDAIFSSGVATDKVRLT